MSLNDKTYKILKWIALYLLPAIGTLYYALSEIWGLPAGKEVVGTITAIDAFLGAVLGISTKNYEGDGTLIVDVKNPDTDIFNLDLNIPIEELPNKDVITFKVNSIK